MPLERPEPPRRSCTPRTARRLGHLLATLGILLSGSLTAGCADREDPVPTVTQLEDEAVAGLDPGPGDIIGTLFYIPDVLDRTPSPASGGVLAVRSRDREEFLRPAGARAMEWIRTHKRGWESVSFLIDAKALDVLDASFAETRDGVFVLESIQKGRYILCRVRRQGGEGEMVAEEIYTVHGCNPDVMLDPPAIEYFAIGEFGIQQYR